MKFFTPKAIGIYIHYPFCMDICPYCDFNTYLTKDIDQEKLLEVYKQELDFFLKKIENPSKFNLNSIYFGGGTPSLMNAVLVEKIINYILKIFNKNSTEVEITLEANPTSFEIKKFKDFKKAGINRVSVGIQSFNDKELQFLGRKHNSKQGIFAIEESFRIFEKTTFDLIFGLPNQTLNQWGENLKKAFELNIKHISLYALTIKDGTPFSTFIKQGRMKEKTEEEMTKFYDFTWKKMKKENFHHYEISNFSKDNIKSLKNINIKSNISIHNMIYWKYFSYIGIGAGASGRIQFNNKIFETKITNSLKKWLSFNNSIQIREISPTEKIDELIIFNLRSKFGINFKDIKNRFNLNLKDFLNEEKIQDFQNQKLLKYNESFLKLTEKGMKFIDYINLNILK